MTVTVTGGGQSSSTINLSTSDLTNILATASPTVAPIVYAASPVVSTVSATLTVPTSLSSTVINVSGLGTGVSVATGADTVTSGAGQAASITGAPAASSAGADTIGLFNTISNSAPITFMPTGLVASVAGSTGTTTITGAGATVNLGSVTDDTPVSRSNETLTGGVVPTTFNLSMDTTPGSGAGITDTIANYSGLDTLNLGGSAANNQALSTYHIVNGSGTFSLGDGTKVVLQDYTGPASSIHLTT